jgi:energy-coupling factor transport system permease protein
VFDLLYTAPAGEQRAGDLLYRLDPRAKLLAVGALVLCLALAAGTPAMLLALGALHLLSAPSRGTRSRIGPLWRVLSPLAITVLLLGSLRWQASPALVALGPLSITGPALWRATGIASRIVGISLALSLMLWTTEPGALAAGLARMGVPFSIGLSFVMTLQYVFTFRRLFHQILEAQQSRGLIVARANPIRAVRAYVPVIVPLLIAALRSVDSLTLALLSRGFGADTRRTSRRVLRMRARDWLSLLVVCAACAGLVWFDRTICL